MSLINNPNVIAPAIEDQPGAAPTFGRLKLFDQRSLEHPMTERLRAIKKKPKRTQRSWRPHWQGDQQRTSQCTAYGSLHLWDMEPVAHPRYSGKYKGYPYPFLDPSVLYCEAQALDPWPGECNAYDGTSTTAMMQALKARGMISDYTWEYKNVDVIVETLLEIGPVGIGVSWYEGMLLKKKDGPYNPDNAILQVTGPEVGGHFTVLNAVDLSKKRKGKELTVFNSWGADWGANGRGYMSLDTLSKLLELDGEAVIISEVP